MENKETSKGAIAQVIDGIIGGIHEEEVELYKRIIGDGALCPIFDPEAFYFKMVYPFEQFINGHIRAEITNHNGMAFLLTNGQFVERLYLAEIKKREGWVCSADKSGVIMKGLADFFRTGCKITWNYDGKYTYHLPKTVFTTHDSVVEFFDAVHAMHCGNSDKYVGWLASNPVDGHADL